MTRHGILTEGGRFGSSEYSQPAIRDRKVFVKAAEILKKALDEEPAFSPKAELVLKAACAQYLGRYPAKTPSRSQIRLVLKEMDRMHGGWKAGFLNMEIAFTNIDRVIREVERYAEENGILPPTR